MKNKEVYHMTIIGYCIPTTDILEVEAELDRVKRRIDKIGSSCYQKLFGYEAAFLYDQMALNVLKKPDSMSFIDWVTSELKFRIRISQQNAIPNKYNLNVFIYVMEEEGKTYLKVICPNEELRKGFKNLEDYSLTEEESKDKNNGKNVFWTRLQKKYENKPVLSLNLTPSPEPVKGKIVFPSLGERCSTLARHDLTNYYLKAMAGNGNIPPYMMMPLMDESLLLLSSDYSKTDLRNRELQLKNILPNEDEILKLLYPEYQEEDID